VTSAELYDRAWNQPTAKDWANVLASLPLFAGLSKRRLRRVAELAKIGEFHRGDLVIQAGDKGDAVHVILSGQARVIGKPRARLLRAGDYFGEMALIDDQPRSATIIAASDDLQTMKLPRRAFLKVVRQDPGIAIAMIAEMTARIRRLETLPASSSSTLTATT
jgi:CRP/FNR family cyclic AMP-dependent transcriptional regulator